MIRKKLIVASENQRIDYIDNLKGIGIILVVFGHYIEPFRDVGFMLNALFICIYMFHMPLFVYASGTVAKFRVRSLIRYFWILYTAQAFYFVLRVLTGEYTYIGIKGFIVDFAGYPYFQLWYLYAILFWVASLCIVNKIKLILDNTRGEYLLSIVVFALCVLGGFVSFRYSLNRVVAFYWFFLVGYLFEKNIRAGIDRIPGLLCVLILAALFTAIAFCSDRINAETLFSNLCYAKGGYMWTERAMFFCLSMLIVVLIGRLLRNKQSLISWLGRNTMPIFVLHTVPYVLLKAAGIHEIVGNLCNPIIALLYAGTFTAIIIFVCTRKPLVAAINFLWEVPMRIIDKNVIRRNK